jgi:AAA+ ATPase superfamily predicted ATPase
MRLKSELYKKEQEEICDKIIEILDLPETNTITLYELDNDKEKQEKIIELIPDIRKYFSFNSIKAVGEPHRIKRPWLSIIKQITKLKYNISAKDHRIKVGDKVVRSILYNIEALSGDK